MSAPGVVAFILARLDEHEHAARAASRFRYLLPSDALWARSAARVADGSALSSDAHIALNDPVHVLSLVAAARYVLEVAEGCASAAATLADVAPGTAEECELRGKADVGRRATLAFAAIWRTHPDYDPAWTPDHRHDFGPDRVTPRHN